MTTKLISIADVGRNLTPIGYTFRSPLLKPKNFTLDKVCRFLFECGCTSVFEHYPADPSCKVKLTIKNYAKTFQEIWEEENPDSIFPYTTGISVEIITPPVKSLQDTDENVNTDTDQLLGDPKDDTLDGPLVANAVEGTDETLTDKNVKTEDDGPAATEGSESTEETAGTDEEVVNKSDVSVETSTEDVTEDTESAGETSTEESEEDKNDSDADKETTTETTQASRTRRRR